MVSDRTEYSVPIKKSNIGLFNWLIQCVLHIVYIIVLLIHCITRCIMVNLPVAESKWTQRLH